MIYESATTYFTLKTTHHRMPSANYTTSENTTLDSDSLKVRGTILTNFA